MLQDQKKSNLYLNRINHILDYIEQNLEKDLSLEKLSQIVHTSPFHFHRIFSLTCGETPYQLVLRKRLEKTASTIMKEKRRLISDISMQYGFDNPASFSRAFKRYYNFTASRLQRRSGGELHQIVREKSKNGKENITLDKYIRDSEAIRRWSQKHAGFSIVREPPRRIAYCRHRGDLDLVANTFVQLKAWANGYKNLVNRRTQWLLLIHDNPAIVSEDMLGQSAGIVIPEKIYHEISSESKASKMIIPNGKYLKGQFNLIDGDIRKSWDAICVYMIDYDLPTRDGYHFEAAHGRDPFTKSMKGIEIFVPLKNS
jgi:AraC family transcriptional regulator